MAVVLLGASTKRRRAVALGAALIVAGAATGVALATESGPDLSAPSPTGVASSVPADLASSFAALGEPRRTKDALPGEAAASLTAPGSFGAHYGVNVEMSRLMGEANGISVWLVPGESGSCILLSSGGSACGSNETVRTEGIFLAIVPTTSNAAPWAVGIVPDGAKVDGATGASGVAMGGNALSDSGAGGNHSFTITTASGASYTHELPSGTPPPAPGAEVPPSAG